MDQVWKQLPDDLVWKIVDHLDAATRRDCGARPRKLDAKWRAFVPRGFVDEFYRYYPAERKSVYFEVCRYGFMLFEVSTEIIIVDAGSHCWRNLMGARSRGVSWTIENGTPTVWDVPTEGGEFQTAGWPEMIGFSSLKTVGASTQSLTV